MLVYKHLVSENTLHTIQSADKILTCNKNPLTEGKSADIDSAYLDFWNKFKIRLCKTHETENLYEKVENNSLI